MNSWSSAESAPRSRVTALGLLKFCTVAVVTAVVGVMAPQYMQQHIDELWVEEAHQALLTSLVDARNHAWESGVTAKLCLADTQRQCLSDESAELAGWRVFTQTSDGLTRTVAFHSFHAQNVALATSAKTSWDTTFGFDAEGYSLQAEVMSFDIYSLSGVSPKTYKVIVEPSGALQTLVNAKIEANVHVALSQWPEREKVLESAL